MFVIRSQCHGRRVTIAIPSHSKAVNIIKALGFRELRNTIINGTYVIFDTQLPQSNNFEALTPYFDNDNIKTMFLREKKYQVKEFKTLLITFIRKVSL